ncbi:TRAP-type C4-dicarboxylate transport system, small permease component [Sporobacter termitidis DSM 10068]|uniref:TRAP-type C4-dicarboxylate transport system, small permease component n=1 Tax=Sporobacter termitidis DSM 10068 TaxID=1123282 RepID=A0A1M5Y5R6_9FIRM|nr:TRAP transporter small permease [Sporobacter termitidis]SHI07425.1 TRAP-type C4-dicarboxylate transport system, small permease component [Sporobacter termitidis DSM 10068]
MKKALKIVDSINLKVCYIAMAALFVLMCMITVDTIMRKTPLGGIPDSQDLTELFLILIVFCGLAFLESDRGHIRVDMFVNMFPRLLKKITEVVMYLLSAGILMLLFYAMLGNIGSTYSSGAATQILRIPHWPFVAVVTVALFLYAFTVLLHGIELITQKDDEKKTEKPAV